MRRWRLCTRSEARQWWWWWNGTPCLQWDNLMDLNHGDGSLALGSGPQGDRGEVGSEGGGWVEVGGGWEGWLKIGCYFLEFHHMCAGSDHISRAAAQYSRGCPRLLPRIPNHRLSDASAEEKSRYFHIPWTQRNDTKRRKFVLSNIPRYFSQTFLVPSKVR